MSGRGCVCLTCCHHGRFRCNDEEASAIGLSRGLTGEDRKHFLFVPDASDSDTAAASHHDERQAAGDKWLVAEVCDIISADWQTWFGTLCVLLWLLYLIVL